MSDTYSLPGTLAVIGGGRMGEAIIGGLIAAGTIVPERVTVAEPADARRTALEQAHGVRCVADGAQALPADVILIAVKPQIADAVIASLASSVRDALVVSIVAGFSTARIESLLPAGTAVVRVMPNTPAMVGEGMAVVSGGGEASAEQIATVEALFARIGRAVVVDERYQNAATAISGSGPAYFALVVDALARAGVRQGLPRDVAQALAVQTMLGTARLLEETGQHPSELIDGVSSPGGTTIAAIEALEAGGLRAAFAQAVAANVKRSQELGS
ncbi:MAG: pyrroline-5-carboxylate reductase [Coriobacteriia bacterium]|nr:pyrroline-5-carboxylate reductase [Coriobacteriia bacterium]